MSERPATQSRSIAHTARRIAAGLTDLSHGALPLALLLAAGSGAAAQSGWRLVQTTDDAHGRDRHPAHPAGGCLADPAPESGGLLPRGYVELHINSEPLTTKAYFTTSQASGGISATTGRSYLGYVAFLGSQQSPYSSLQIFAHLVTAKRLTIRYRAFGTGRTASCHVTDLPAAVVKLAECRWTQVGLPAPGRGTLDARCQDRRGTHSELAVSSAEIDAINAAEFSTS